MIATGSVHRLLRAARRGVLLTASVTLAALMVVAGIPGGVAPAGAAATVTFAWDTRADFESNASTTLQPTTRVNTSTQRVPGSIALPGPVTTVAAGLYHSVGLKSDGTVVAVGGNGFGQCDVSGWTDIVAVATGNFHTVGLKSDGTVVAVGGNGFGQCDVSGWTDIVAVAAGSHHTVGLKSDGTVVAVGYNGEGRCEVSGWTGIAAIAAGSYHTLGLNTDGTVVAVGDNASGQCNTSGWTNIVALDGGLHHTVGLKSDGTAVAVGWDSNGQCGISGWTDLVAVAAGDAHTVGLKSDGTAAAVGYADNGQCNVSGWSGITAVAAGGAHTVGLSSGGTVAVGNNTNGQCEVSGWSDFVGVAAGGFHTVGLKSDGTAVAAGLLSDGQCDVSGWSGIVEVAGGDKHSVGLKSDGTVVAAGLDSSGQCGVSEWSDVTAVTTGDNHTVGLKSNGTVVAVGANGDGQLGVSGWSDIVAIAAGQAHTVGLKSDGTAVAVGNNANGQCNVSEWSDIVAVAAGGDHTLGLKSDGTVVAVGRNLDSECEVSGWSGVVALTAGRDFTLGLKSDGTVVAVGNNVSGQCNVSGWSETTVISAGLAYAVGLKSDGTVLAVGEGSYGQLGCTSWTSIPLGSRHGAIGGAGSAVGLRAHVPSGLGGWTKLDSATSALRPGEAVKFAVRLSADGVNWSGPLGHDGQPIDWTNQTGNYLGRAVSDAGSRVDLSQLQALPYIDIVVRIESAGVVSPVVKSAVLEYQVNEAPIAIADVYSVAEDSTLTRVAPGVLGNDTDPEGGTLTAIKGSGPEHGTLTLDADGSFIYTPHADWYGTDTFTYKANDGSMYSNPATVTITVNPVIDPSTITVTSVSKTLSAPGAYYTFSGTLGSGGTAVAGRRVVLQSAGSAAGPWANTAVFTQTAADGRFALRIKPLNKTYYRASFAGDVDFSACLSSARFATPKVSLGAPVAPKTMRRSKVYTVYGSLKPKHTAGTKPVRIYRERKVAGKWKKFGYVRATAYTYKGYSRYKVKMGLTTRGSWRLRAYAPADSRHAATWSSKYDYVRVE